MQAAVTQSSIDEQLAQRMGLFYDDPLGFVMYAYAWDTDPSLQIVELVEPWKSRYNCKYGPSPWQCEYLDELGEEIRKRNFNGRDPVEPIQDATASGHGIGKSAIVAWLVNFIMSTRPFCKGTITANTNTQLETKTWAEIRKWTERCITGHWFKITTGKGNMRMAHAQHPATWFCSAQTCKEENSEAFAGQHAVDSTSFYIFDEASAVPEAIWEVAKGGLTDGEPWFLTFGNPTKNNTSFHACFNSQRHRWRHRQIDSRTVPITNKVEIDKWIEDYGIESDFVKVRVLGQFPSAGTLQLISTRLAGDAKGRILREDSYKHAPKIISADVAWEGEDQYVLGMRQGLACWIFGRYRELPSQTMTFANLIAQKYDEHNADAIVVDATGVGAGVIDRLRQMGYKPIPIFYGGAADDPQRFANKRIEMWWRLREWLEQGGCYPDDLELFNDLTAPEYDYHPHSGKMILESKKDMKKRGLPSTDTADMLAQTFAVSVHKKVEDPEFPIPPRRTQADGDYDVLGYR
jgi:hypothetical protein